MEKQGMFLTREKTRQPRMFRHDPGTAAKTKARLPANGRPFCAEASVKNQAEVTLSAQMAQRWKRHQVSYARGAHQQAGQNSGIPVHLKYKHPGSA
jgi:hypothetical protein